MTDLQKSTTSASNLKSKRPEAKKSFNPLNIMPNSERTLAQRHLYGGMLFPSRVIPIKEMQSLECEAK